MTKSKTIRRAIILTISIPNDVAQYLKSKKQSEYITELVRADMQRQAVPVQTTTMTAEEVEIREALKLRDALLKRNPYIANWEDYILNKTGNPLTWESLTDDQKRYVEVFQKYNQDTSSDLYYLWRNVRRQVEEEKEHQRELWLKEELTSGLTRGEILQIIEEYKTPGINRLSISEVVEALGLPYHQVYNKVLPMLRHEGYEIRSSRD